ncbi:hypothetical protein MMJ63_26020, partial [Bacillus vallismortis]|nr:hypothetical protein [Bacillus vallismortis]
SVAGLTHPGLVAVYAQGQDGDHVFLVMELVEGGTLRELLRDEPAPLADFAVGDLTIRLHRTATSVFAIVRRKGSTGGLAV